MKRLLVFLFLTTQAFGAYSYYRTLTVDHAKCGSSDSSNFPVLVSISHSTLKTVAYGGHIQQTTTQSGPAVAIPADLIFSADSSGNTKYPWEVESYDGTNGILVAWVKLPTVSYTVDTPFYMLYGDATISTPQNTGSYSPANVWDGNYKGVYHLAAGLSVNASTSGGLGNGTNNGATATVGKIGGGAGFVPGSSQWIDLANNGTHYTNLTVAAWVKFTSFSAIQDLVSKGFDGTSNTEWELTMLTSGKLYWRAYNSGAVRGVANSTATLSTGTWYHLVGTYNSANTTWTLYINGSQDTSTNAGAGPPSVAQKLEIGAVDIAGDPSDRKSVV